MCNIGDTIACDMETTHVITEIINIVSIRTTDGEHYEVCTPEHADGKAIIYRDGFNDAEEHVIIISNKCVNSEMLVDLI